MNFKVKKFNKGAEIFWILGMFLVPLGAAICNKANLGISMIAAPAFIIHSAIESIAPSFFNVDGVLYDKCDEFIYPDTMRKRKELMEQMSDAFIMTPGGVGTFDEFFEILTLKQLGLHSKPIAIFNINGYFNNLIATLNSAVETKFMDSRTTDLCPVFEDADELVTYLENYKGEAKLFKCIAGEK